MTVHRLAKYQTDDPFTRVPNAAVNDDRLDLKARGLLLLMLSLPDDWVFRERHLAEKAGVGREQVRTAMRRLVEAGYVVRRREAFDGKPPITVTEVYDRAQDTEVGKPEVGKSDRRETRPLSNNEVPLTKKSTNTARSRKTAVPDSWQPASTNIRQLQDKFPKVDVTGQVDTFLDYHRSKGSKFADWDAAFRNWVRNAEKFRQQAEGVKPGGWR
ncbi:MAG TPA: GntR family transcriptional regulator [Acidimicrobiia bacterium]